MSRLDSFIRRLTAQRACLEAAVALLDGGPGPVLEVGLGNGRTYDHLRELLPEREIFVFDRQIAAHPDCVPDSRHMIQGEFHETIPTALDRLGAPAVLAHCDFGSGDIAVTAVLALWLGPELTALLADGAVVASDQPLQAPGLAALALPDGVAVGRYHLYRYSAGAEAPES
jgi:hypothetical protein